MVDPSDVPLQRVRRADRVGRHDDGPLGAARSGRREPFRDVSRRRPIPPDPRESPAWRVLMRVAWRRTILEPPEAGPCEEPTCRTIPLGLDVPLLVAVYELGISSARLSAGDATPIVLRVCAPCDLAILEREAARQATLP
jgi:hypothetical protein